MTSSAAKRAVNRLVLDVNGAVSAQSQENFRQAVRAMTLVDIEKSMVAIIVESALVQAEVARCKTKILELESSEEKMDRRIKDLEKQNADLARMLNFKCDRCFDDVGISPIVYGMMRKSNAGTFPESADDQQSSEWSDVQPVDPNEDQGPTPTKLPFVMKEPRRRSYQVEDESVISPRPTMTAARALMTLAEGTSISHNPEPVCFSKNISTTKIKNLASAKSFVFLPPLPPTPVFKRRHDFRLPLPPQLAVHNRNGTVQVRLNTPSFSGKSAAKLAKFQIYVCNSPFWNPDEHPYELQWELAGEIVAQKLPMICHLPPTIINCCKYFIARAVDVHGQIGGFCEPKMILLK